MYSSPDSPDSLDFLSPPLDFLQLKCPICLELLLESPIFFTCCGNHVCGSCIKNSTKDHVPYVKHYIYIYDKVCNKSDQRAVE